MCDDTRSLTRHRTPLQDGTHVGAQEISVHENKDPCVCNRCYSCFTQIPLLGKQKRRFHHYEGTNLISNNDNNGDGKKR